MGSNLIPVHFVNSKTGKHMDDGPWYLRTIPRINEFVIHGASRYIVIGVTYDLRNMITTVRLSIL